MRILLFLVLSAGALQAEGKRDFLELYARMERYTVGPRVAMPAPPCPSKP